MNWRTQSFIYDEDYLLKINSKLLDIVLVENPNPLGMAVRVFRHLCIKDAQKITLSVTNYLATCTSKLTFEELKESEIRSYGSSAIKPATYEFFEYLQQNEDLEIHERFGAASDHLQRGWNASYFQAN